MIKHLSYSRARDLSALHDELIAAGIRPSYVGGSAVDPDGVVLEVPDDVDEALVATVVAAHDGAAALARRQAARQAEVDDDAAIKPLLDDVATALEVATGPVRTLLRVVHVLLRLELRRRGG